MFERQSQAGDAWDFVNTDLGSEPQFVLLRLSCEERTGPTLPSASCFSR